jgi:hypothetical protein
VGSVAAEWMGFAGGRLVGWEEGAPYAVFGLDPDGLAVALGTVLAAAIGAGDIEGTWGESARAASVGSLTTTGAGVAAATTPLAVSTGTGWRE